MDSIRTTLGPRGMDKLVWTGQKVTISNDGATLMKLLQIVHPAANTLVQVCAAPAPRIHTVAPTALACAAASARVVGGDKRGGEVGWMRVGDRAVEVSRAMRAAFWR